MNRINLFVSYSHEDGQDGRDYLKQFLKVLKQLKQFNIDYDFDGNLNPGDKIDEKIEKMMEQSDIFVFLVSPDWLTSDACKQEWMTAKELCANDDYKKLVPVILRDCLWSDFDDMKTRLAIPNDGNPISKHDDKDTAWKDVQKGLKRVIDELRTKFDAKPQFLSEIRGLEFFAQCKDKLVLDDVFVFPTLTYRDEKGEVYYVDDEESILTEKFVLIVGDELSGKTALCHHLLLHLLEKNNRVLYVDLKEVQSRKPTNKLYEDIYSKSFRGDYELWCDNSSKTVILDNMTEHANCLDHIEYCQNKFDRIILTVSTDIHQAYFRTESCLAEFTQIDIRNLSRVTLEKMVRKWLMLSQESEAVSDELVDRTEQDILSILMSNSIFPRYPYYILTILQTREAFVPQNLQFTAYGHCHYVIILAHLIKSGVKKEDAELNACLSFGSNYAYFLYKNDLIDNEPVSEELFRSFVAEYKREYVIDDRLINRLLLQDFGIIKNFRFKKPYIFYFFLGMHLSSEHDDPEIWKVIEEMAGTSYKSKNCYALMSLIHHSKNQKVIDKIRERTMGSLAEVKPATLDRSETQKFQNLIKAIPDDITNKKSTESNREEERKKLDKIEEKNVDELEANQDDENNAIENEINDIYRILKSSDILSQIIRNNYGNIKKDRLRLIVEEITNGGLRILQRIFLTQEEFLELAKFVKQKYPDIDTEKTKKQVSQLTFIFTLGLLMRISNSLSIYEIREIIESVMEDGGTPAHDLIEYFSWLSSLDRELKLEDSKRLRSLLNKNQDRVIQRLISLRTQLHLNTHAVSDQVAQSFNSRLNLEYRRRFHSASHKRISKKN